MSDDITDEMYRAHTGTIQCLVKTWMRHKERIAMIRMGMHPDLGVEKPHYEEQEV